MKRQNEETLGSVIERFIKENGLAEKLDEALVASLWDKEMGPAIASRTKSLQLKKGVLTVKVESSVMREELLRQRSRVIEIINNSAERAVIQDFKVF